MTARVSMLLKSRASLTCFRAFILPGRAKDLICTLGVYRVSDEPTAAICMAYNCEHHVE